MRINYNNKSKWIRSPRIRIHFHSNFIHAWEWVHDDHRLVGASEGVWSDNERVLHLIVLGWVVEALFLDTSDVQNVRLW
jgi:hypothetical protein